MLSNHSLLYRGENEKGSETCENEIIDELRFIRNTFLMTNSYNSLSPCVGNLLENPTDTDTKQIQYLKPNTYLYDNLCMRIAPYGSVFLLPFFRCHNFESWVWKLSKMNWATLGIYASAHICMAKFIKTSSSWVSHLRVISILHDRLQIFVRSD